MNTPAEYQKELFDASSMLACFDGENLSSIHPLREFFEQGGMVVQENGVDPTPCLYQVVFGSSNSVKQILSRKPRTCFRLLILLTSGTEEEARYLAHYFNASVAVIGERLVGQAEAREVFGFLCTNKTSVLILKKPLFSSPQNPEKPMSPLVIETKTFAKRVSQLPDLWEQDKIRISKEIEEIYTPPKNSYSSFFMFSRLFSRFFLFSCITFFLLFMFAFLFSVFALFLSSKNLIRNSFLNSSVLSIASTILMSETNIVTEIGGVFPVSPIRTAERVLSIAYKGSQLLIVENDLSLSFPFQTFLGQSSTVSNQIYFQLPGVAAKMRTALQTIDDIRADITVLKIKKLPLFLQTILSRFSVKLNDGFTSISTMKHFVDFYPILAPIDDDKTYLLLFQNNNELRPTGGFIGSLGYVTFHKGNISAVDVEDVYTIDGQLRGHVDPPLPIRTLLNQEHWYLRDSNWNPDFESSGQKAAWFLNKSVGKKVDGVIAINLSFLEDLLSVTGPVTLPDTHLVLSKDTVADSLEATIKSNFFPGSTGKKDLLSTLSFSLFDKMKQGDISPEKIISLLSRAIQKKDILFTTNDQDINTRLRILGWSNSFLLPSLCTEEVSCEESLISPVEANLSVSKVNKNISRSFKREVDFTGRGNIETNDTVTITNNAPQSGTGETYTTYLRLYYPDSSTISSVSLGDTNLFIHKEASFSARPVPYAEIIHEQEGMTTIGIAARVFDRESVQIHVTSLSLNATANTYRLKIDKQPGIDRFPVSISGNLPKDWDTKVSNLPVSASFVARKGFFEYTTDVDRDTAISFSFIHP